MPDETDGARALALHGAGDLTPMERMFGQIVQLATNPDVDAGKMSSLVDLQMKMMDYDKQQQFNKDKIAALREMPSITKRGAITNKAGGVQSRYARFEDIMRVVKPILDAHNLALSFNVGNTGQGVTVQPILSHLNGFVERGSEMWLPLDTTGSKNGTQGAGSAAAYGKRHTAKAMLNIVEEGIDDDGTGAGTPSAQPAWADGLLTAGRLAAREGVERYRAWFQSQTNMQKGWLVDEGHHKDLQEAAANQPG